MSFGFYFDEQLKNHPSMQLSDAVKLCYQAAFGAEHLLSDGERARKYLYAEFESVGDTDEPLFERISNDYCRVNLGAWKREKMSPELLFEIFKSSAKIVDNGMEAFEQNLMIAHLVLKEKAPDFDEEKWQNFLFEYRKMGCPPVHHSDEYRAHEHPAYRIVKIKEMEKIL